MASENKKIKNSHCCGSALKEKEMKIEWPLFYNQSKIRAGKLVTMEYLDD